MSRAEYEAEGTAGPAARFWSRVDRQPEGCWLWEGSVNSKGYGVVSVGGKLQLTHRHAYALAFGAVPDGSLVLHRCDVRRCVRPDHLFIGSHADNSADKLAKGRQSKGESHGRAKLTAAGVAELRRRREDGATWDAIEDEFGVSGRHARDVVAGRAWGHVA